MAYILPVGASSRTMRQARDLLFKILDSAVTDATIGFRIGEKLYILGSGAEKPEPEIILKINNERLFSRIIAFGNLGLGEGYMEGDFEIEKGELYDFLILLLRNHVDSKVRHDKRLLLKAGVLKLTAYLDGKAHNVQRHYDIGDDLFQTFLDPTMTYSCGFANSPDDSLETLQQNKLDRICRKLDLRPGDRLLDIGCGYGGLMIHAARNYGVTGQGITLSRNHAARGNENIAALNLADQIKIEYADFADLKGSFDKVVSVGMFEHVPIKQYPLYFKRIREVMKPRSMGLVHSIGCNAPRNINDPFFQKYIFPGSNQPRLSEMSTGLEKNELRILDVENIAKHYGYTVLWWLRNFRRNKDQLDPGKYDEIFHRMWEYYFHCGIAAAFASDSAVYQVLFSLDRAARPPLARV